MIRGIAQGEQITEPGAYRMPMEWYHTQDVCPGPSVSSSGLRTIALQSPLAFWKTWDGNPNRYPAKKPSDSLILGKAAHSLILGDEVFDEHFFYVPDDAPRRPTVTQVKAFERDGKWNDAAAEGCGMTYRTPEEARTMPFPIARTFGEGKASTCDGPDCILWRKREILANDPAFKVAVRSEVARLAAAAGKKPAPAYHQEAVANVSADLRAHGIVEDRGYCGLGGQP